MKINKTSNKKHIEVIFNKLDWRERGYYGQNFAKCVTVEISFTASKYKYMFLYQNVAQDFVF